MDKRPYIVVAPPFVRNSAGVRVLHKLVDDLNKKGYDARHQDFVSLDAPYPRIKEILDEAIVVYPELISGNPLNSRRVVRYVLHYPGKLGGDCYYPESETVFCYNDDHKKCVDERMNRNCELLTIPIIDQNIFNRKGELKERKGIWEYHGKKNNPDYTPENPKYPLITRTTPDSQEKLAEIFKSIEYLICYDDMTAVFNEARLCGCPVIIKSDQDPKRWKSVYCGYGIGFHEVELSYAKDTVELYPQAYRKLELDYEDQLNRFIERTQYEFK